MDRSIAVIKIRQFIAYDKEYTTKQFYLDCKHEIVWNCHICNEDDFMKKEAFYNWMKTFDWIERIGRNSKGENIYKRKDPAPPKLCCKISEIGQQVNNSLLNLRYKKISWCPWLR